MTIENLTWIVAATFIFGVVHMIVILMMAREQQRMADRLAYLEAVVINLVHIRDTK